tara:strand:+ start:598 stop:876 length:279 start_codon:yes stop_codon:yes gene_type:complete
MNEKNERNRLAESWSVVFFDIRYIQNMGNDILPNKNMLGGIMMNEGNYNCDKCNYLGNFNDGDICGVGEGNMEKFLCNDCILIEIEKEKNDN